MTIFKEKGHKPNDKFNRALDEIEKALATLQGEGLKYSFSNKNVKSFRHIMEMAAKSGKIENFRQALGRAIYANLTTKATLGRQKIGGRWRWKIISSKEALLNGAKEFLNDIKGEIGEQQFEELVSVNGEVTLVFVIDTTGSMLEDIAAAKAIAEGIIYHKREVPVSFILSEFNDPDVRPITFRDETELDKAVKDLNRIKVTGGGDCPEKTFEGMLKALYYSPMPGSAMYVFTDASPKDGTEENIESVKALAIDLGIAIYFFTKGDCGNPKSVESFRALAQDTGGFMFPLHNSDQIKKLSNFVKQNLHGTSTVSAQSSQKAKNNIKTYVIPVDDTIGTVIITVTTSSPSRDSVTLYSPDNIAQNITHDLELNLIFEVKDPAPGNWTLTVTRSAGDHEYFVRIINKLSIDFSHYYFKYPPRPDGRHIPVAHPLLGEDAMVMIKVSKINKVIDKSLRLRAIYKNGTKGNEFMLEKVGDSGMRFRATIKLHAGPYKLQLSGNTKKGSLFTRLTSTYDEAKPFRLRVVYARKYTLPLGRNSTLLLAIENFSTERNFTFNVTDSFGYANYKGTRLEHKGPFYDNIIFRLKFHVPANDTRNVNKTNRVVIKAIGDQSRVSSTLVMYLFVVGP